MTELAPFATLLSPEDHNVPELTGSCGRPVASMEVRVVDPADNEVPRGTVGEIVARGDHVMLGYWNKPEETEVAIRGGWMHTGDGGFMDEHGYVFVVDRIKDMIITGGENVYSAEVEHALAEHPAVASCAVIGVPDPDWGERVHAVVVLQPGADRPRRCCAPRLLSRLHRQLQAAPQRRVRDALPVSGAGKILKRELRAAYT